MRKKDSFEGERMIVLPQLVIETLTTNTFTKHLHLTDIGIFPNAKYHIRERLQGAKENILIYCIDGKGYIEMYGDKKQLMPNQYYIIPKNTAHKYYADVRNPWTIYWIHFDGTNAEHFILGNEYPREIPVSHSSRFEERLQLFGEILMTLDDNFSVTNLEYSSVLLTQFLGSLKYFSHYRKVKEIEQNDVISKATRFIKDNLNRKIKVEEIAVFCNLSLSHFCLLFKKQTSHTPVEYITMLRIQKACNLLCFSRFKINEIANQVGYDDAFYFTRIFTKTMGVSPKEYRVSKV